MPTSETETFNSAAWVFMGTVLFSGEVDLDLPTDYDFDKALYTEQVQFSYPIGTRFVASWREESGDEVRDASSPEFSTFTEALAALESADVWYKSGVITALWGNLYVAKEQVVYKQIAWYAETAVVTGSDWFVWIEPVKDSRVDLHAYKDGGLLTKTVSRLRDFVMSKVSA